MTGRRARSTRVEAGESRPFESVVDRPERAPGAGLLPRPARAPVPRRRGCATATCAPTPQGQLAAHVLGRHGEDQRRGDRRLPQPRATRATRPSARAASSRSTRASCAARPAATRARSTPPGEPTGREVVVVARAAARAATSSSRSTRPPSAALQDALAEQVSLNGLSTGGAGVALDPNTGEVLAHGLLPGLRPLAVRERLPEADRGRHRGPGQPAPRTGPSAATTRPGRPSRRSAPRRACEGGFITADEQIESPSEIELYKTVFPNFRKRSHGFVNLPTALEVSSDTYFYQLGDEFYRAQGSPLQEEARSFGLGERTGLDLPGEIDGLIPDPAWKRQNFAGRAVHRPRPRAGSRATRSTCRSARATWA